jgi:hypothetical protein
MLLLLLLVVKPVKLPCLLLPAAGPLVQQSRCLPDTSA